MKPTGVYWLHVMYLITHFRENYLVDTIFENLEAQALPNYIYVT